MIEKKLMIVNKLGLHARAAAKLVTLASTFQSEFELKCKGRAANGKSIMSLMMLAAGQGCEVMLTVSGDDQKQAITAVEKLINERFDEVE